MFDDAVTIKSFHPVARWDSRYTEYYLTNNPTMAHSCNGNEWIDTLTGNSIAIDTENMLFIGGPRNNVE